MNNQMENNNREQEYLDRIAVAEEAVVQVFETMGVVYEPTGKLSDAVAYIYDHSAKIDICIGCQLKLAGKMQRLIEKNKKEEVVQNGK